MSTESVITHEFGFADYHRHNDAIVVLLTRSLCRVYAMGSYPSVYTPQHLLCCTNNRVPVLASEESVAEVGRFSRNQLHSRATAATFTDTANISQDRSKSPRNPT